MEVPPHSSSRCLLFDFHYLNQDRPISVDGSPRPIKRSPVHFVRPFVIRRVSSQHLADVRLVTNGRKGIANWSATHLGAWQLRSRHALRVLKTKEALFVGFVHLHLRFQKQCLLVLGHYDFLILCVCSNVETPVTGLIRTSNEFCFMYGYREAASGVVLLILLDLIISDLSRKSELGQGTAALPWFPACQFQSLPVNNNNHHHYHHIILCYFENNIFKIIASKKFRFKIAKNICLMLIR